MQGPAKFHDARLRAAVVGASLSVLWVGCGGGEPQGPRHVLLISLDTTRADHLGCYGSEVATPSIDALADEASVFLECTSTAPTTLASHTSLMTGRHPSSHGVPRNGFTLDPRNTTLAEQLSEAGFWCAAFLGSFALDRRFGFDQGFDHFDQEFDQGAGSGGRDQDQRSADAVTSALLEHVDTVVGRPGFERSGRLFLFAHYFDPHAPYGAPGTAAAIEAAVRSQQERAIGRGLGQQAVIAGGLSAELVLGADGRATPEDRTLARLYAEEITRTDAAIGRLLAGLASRGLMEDTLVVLTADHGETFHEHANFWNHGLWVHQTDVHVPLIVRAPSIERARIGTPVSGVDVAPTILDLLGLQASAEVQGRSLRPLLEGESLEPVPIFAEATQPGPRVEPKEGWRNAAKPRCVRSGRWKLIRAPYVGVEQLYDLETDPGEQRNLLAAGATLPEAAPLDELRRELDAFASGARPLPSSFDRTNEEETRARLGALGYAEADDR